MRIQFSFNKLIKKKILKNPSGSDVNNNNANGISEWLFTNGIFRANLSKIEWKFSRQWIEMVGLCMNWVGID